MPKQSIPKLPQLLERKIYKSGQTRGADDDEIYQNRVGRTSTVLIPFHFWNNDIKQLLANGFFEAGYLVLIKPEVYFSFKEPATELAAQGLSLGDNCLVFYETRQQWNNHNPDQLGWTPACSRLSPLGGEYTARVPATTALADGGKVIRGFSATAQKGAGIRQYEYSTADTVLKCRMQLEAEYWMCFDSVEAAVDFGMTSDEANLRKTYALTTAEASGLLDLDRLCAGRTINKLGETVCPLCLERLSGYGFFNRMAQAAGREVPDITVTEINLFHIEELRYGVYNHRPYNVGWGHHHCNVVVKDAGISPTLQWMKRVIARNESMGTTIDID